MIQYQGTRILISGGAGFVGSNLTKRLLRDEARVIHIVDNLLSSERHNIPDDRRVQFTEASVGDDGFLGSLDDDYDYVFHVSTYHGNQSSIHDPLADHENNTLTTLKLYERLKDFRDVKKIVYTGAGCAVAEKTFDSAEATEESDNVSLHMDSPYSMSKIFGEYYSCYYHKQHGLPVVRVRFQNVYGPGEILGAGDWRGTPATVWRNVVPTFIYKALKGQSLPLENEGVATRDFIYVADIVEGLLLAGSKGEPGDVYNLATGEETSILNLAELIVEIAGSSAAVELKPKRDWDNSGKRFGSTVKSEMDLGFKASTGIRSGLEATIKWFRENLSLIESVIDKHRKYLEY
ncbi:MAG: NAD-dependent epimerase/dehydratase family protein [SAR202 cluster bacterium]|jgi:nucleoside-diphosphate-sugar epimerase|nr:NAD-dependent epimerase/dehydratase family protein [SAR202 cluster bacterium]